MAKVALRWLLDRAVGGMVGNAAYSAAVLGFSALVAVVGLTTTPKFLRTNSLVLESHDYGGMESYNPGYYVIDSYNPGYYIRKK